MGRNALRWVLLEAWKSPHDPNGESTKRLRHWKALKATC